MAKSSNTSSQAKTPAPATTKSSRFVKGQKKVPGSGRKKGVQNKSTTEFRKVFSDILQHEIDMNHILVALEDLRCESPKDYIASLIKIAQFNLPQLQSVEFNGQVETTDTFMDHMAKMAGLSSEIDKSNTSK